MERRGKADKQRVMIGTIVTVSSPQVMEIVVQAGYDWVLIDMEHSVLSLSDVQTMLAVAGDRLLTIVRVPSNDSVAIKRILDTGCNGILVPMVNSREEAERTIASAMYPPEGLRSVGIGRAHGYGASFGEYVRTANDRTIVMVQAEHVRCVQNIDFIASTPGISAVFIGPYDLSASMNLAGRISHPDVVAAVSHIKSTCSNAGIPWGIFSMSTHELTSHINDGCRYALCGIDVSLLSSSLLKQLTDLNDLTEGVEHSTKE